MTPILSAATGFVSTVDMQNADPWYEVHAFYGCGPCFAVGEGQSLREGTTLTVFRDDGRLEQATVQRVVPMQTAKEEFNARGGINVLLKDKELWDRLGCGRPSGAGRGHGRRAGGGNARS